MSGYWFPFQIRDGSPDHDRFRPRTGFGTVLDRYDFDHHLRILIVKAVEQIEISARAVVSDTMCVQFGPHWYLNPAHFSVRFDHCSFLRRVRRETGIDPVNLHRQADFIRHYLRTYDDPAMPPGWMIFETLSFGAVSRVFANLHDSEKKPIAKNFELPRDRLQSWLHAVAHLRNLCAHHSRVWNREFRITPSVARRGPSIPASRRFYNHAVAVQTLLKRISDNAGWAEGLLALFEAHPDIPLAQMGFPLDWAEQEIWS
ncbi:MAG: Abi family protein [Albidovulum sp.]|nr:Abi family protein [Albidovulum sp.]MDE0534615.1 Abi family protein [Albidovulum sp.]